MYASSAPQNQWAHACDNVIATRFPENSPEHVTTTQEISERRKFHASARLADQPSRGIINDTLRELNSVEVTTILPPTSPAFFRPRNDEGTAQQPEASGSAR